MKALLVGYGSIGRRHLSNFHALGVQDWAVVHTGMGTLPFEPPCPVRSYDTIADALSESPDFAVIANPTNLHVAAALMAVEAGCDVLLEKPLSHSLDGVDALQDAVAASDARVLLGFQFRFDPGFLRVAEIMASGSLGDPLHVRAVWGEYLPGWHPWEDWRVGYAARRELGGGAHHSLCHPLDYLCMLFGDAVGVMGFLRTNGPLGLDVAESADITLRFQQSVTAQVHLDYWARPRSHSVEIVCTDGTLTWDYMTGALRTWHHNAEAWRSERFAGVEGRDELFVAEARHFLEVVDRRAEPVCTLRDGIRAVELCLAIESSSALNGAEVGLLPSGAATVDDQGGAGHVRRRV